MSKPSEPDSNWYRDSNELVHTLRRGRGGRIRPPRIEGYDGLHELRRGGQGVVYVGQQRSTNRKVAIKVMKEGVLDEAARRRRFEREIELVAGMSDRRIVGVYDSGFTAEDHPYLVMEFVDGVPLDEYQVARREDAGHPPRLEETLRLFVRICQAVNHAHQRGVIHRDLKPSNILIDAAGEPHVLDFGVARPPATDLPTTDTEGFLGTLAYASPEQVSQEPGAIDVRTDVYALGVVLYQLLTGRFPYPVSGPLAEVIQAVTTTAPDAPSVAARQAELETQAPDSFAGQINHEIDTITMTALAKEPDRRYATAGALGEDVKRYLDGQAIEAKRDNPQYVLGKLLSRHKLVTSLLVVLMLAVVGFSAGMSAMYHEASTEAEKATQIRIFLEDTLASVDPGMPGGDVTVRAVLNEAVHWIELALADQPEVRAAIQATIGNSYRALGEYDAADTQLQESLAIRQDLHGEESLEAANSMSLLALLHSDRGDYHEAVRLVNEVIAMRRRLFGDDDLGVAQGMSNLGLILQARGSMQEAGQAWQDALRLRQAQLGSSDPSTAMSRFRLAEWQAATMDLANAVQNHEAVLAVRRECLHAEHPDMERSLLALGQVYVQLGRADEAEPLLQECYELRRNRLPQGHYRIAEVDVALGDCLARKGDANGAERHLKRALESVPADVGANDPVRRGALRTLVQLCEASGRSAEAELYRAELEQTDGHPASPQ